MNPPDGPIRVVLDTNVLIAAVRAPRSSSRRIVTACGTARLVALVSRPLVGEYDRIRRRALRGVHAGRLLDEFLAKAENVEIDPARHPVPDDPDDAKVLATAADGAAQVLVSSDRHLLCLDPYGAVRILTPTAARQWLDGESESSE